MSIVQKRKFYFNLKGTVLLFLVLTGISLGQSNWEMINPLPQSNNLRSVAYDNSQFIAVGDAGTILSSDNGTVWKIESSGITNNLNYVAFCNNMFVAVGDTGTILTSPDGKTWSVKMSGKIDKLNCVIFANNQFVAVGDSGTILTSPDGSTWTNIVSGTIVNLHSVAYGNNQFMAVGEKIISVRNGSSHAMILTSSDGTNWTIKYHSNEPYTFEFLNSITYSNGKYIVVGRITSNDMCKGGCYSTAMILTSTDGSTWTRTYLDKEPYSSLNSVIFGKNQFMAVGVYEKINGGYRGNENALIVNSIDGTTWTKINPILNNCLYSLAFGNKRFVAVGVNGAILTSQIKSDNSCKATNIGNGTIEFEVTFSTPQQYVEIFACHNGIQNVAQNIVNNVVYNNDGTATYKLTRSGYSQGDIVEYRFFSYSENIQRVFTPGPVENSWDSLNVNK